MATTATTKVKLKLMIDKTAKKVLFAEAEKDFVDILFNLLYMPFGSFTKHLRNAGMPGCAGNLYQSFENLDEAYLHPNQKKIELLKPFPKWEKASELLQPQSIARVSYNPCVKIVFNEAGIVKFSTYMVTDDLSVTPGSMVSAIGMLQSKVEDIGALENIVVEIGPDEVLEILKASMLSDAALTTVFLKDEAVRRRCTRTTTNRTQPSARKNA